MPLHKLRISKQTKHLSVVLSLESDLLSSVVLGIWLLQVRFLRQNTNSGYLGKHYWRRC